MIMATGAAQKKSHITITKKNTILCQNHTKDEEYAYEDDEVFVLGR